MPHGLLGETFPADSGWDAKPDYRGPTVNCQRFAIAQFESPGPSCLIQGAKFKLTHYPTCRLFFRRACPHSRFGPDAAVIVSSRVQSRAFLREWRRGICFSRVTGLFACVPAASYCR